MSKHYSYNFIIAITQFMLGIIILVSTLYYVKPKGVPFGIVIVTTAGFMVSGVIFFIMGIRKHKKYSVSKEDKDIWE